ncbi:ATP-binding cassette domain-containing protein [candidate division WOR-3 bacterium]|uniref:ATP-binding cassette domain-containing protein n=1 Tax=candidate division WOR-3 bacterium TaxID=2052148 RepID=A0A9D5K8V1_UNCW3|nr:ATP-binding cassette domain-containing protein [candidate division WOR-3 bacterium]MBD3364492.1 ATP-binding cassette domain-containing protein [candidate division WOR-3 bacterium]
MSKGYLLEAKGIKRVYVNGDEEVEALRDANLKLKKGEAVSIFGPSGSGKSTFLHIIGAFDRPTDGLIEFDGRMISAMTDEELAEFRNREVGFVFQFHHLLPEFSALENVALPLLISGSGKKEAYEKARALLSEVGLAERINFLPVKLSGGEKQRVAVARALVHDPRIVLADEPTGNLDRETEAEVMEIFSRLNRKKKITFVIVSHNLLVKKFTDKHYDLIDGKM